MSAWTIWCIAAGVVVSLELLTGTFYLLMIALGLAAAAVVAFFGAASAYATDRGGFGGRSGHADTA
ncbi:NfeD family protein [Undibacterium curvum]|uniref:NfeD family protein n=1 Tax=Undibacterium curvum TaxID=2762294 RepID=UPI003D0A6242